MCSVFWDLKGLNYFELSCNHASTFTLNLKITAAEFKPPSKTLPFGNLVGL